MCPLWCRILTNEKSSLPADKLYILLVIFFFYFLVFFPIFLCVSLRGLQTIFSKVLHCWLPIKLGHRRPWYLCGLWGHNTSDVAVPTVDTAADSRSLRVPESVGQRSPSVPVLDLGVPSKPLHLFPPSILGSLVWQIRWSNTCCVNGPWEVQASSSGCPRGGVTINTTSLSEILSSVHNRLKFAFLQPER